MKPFLQELLADFPAAPEIGRAEVYCSNHIVIFRANATIAQEAILQGCHEFIFMGKESSQVRVDGTTLPLEAEHVFPINRGQRHCAARGGVIATYYPMFVDSNMLQTLAYHLYGLHDVSFRNTNMSVDDALASLMMQFVRECTLMQPGSDLILDCLDTQICVALLRTLFQQHEERGYTEQLLMRKAQEYIRETSAAKLSLQEIADHVNYSPHHFIRVFKRTTGKTPIEYLIDVKLERAETLLKDKTLTITEVCHGSGFNSVSYFSTI